MSPYEIDSLSLYDPLAVVVAALRFLDGTIQCHRYYFEEYMQ